MSALNRKADMLALETDVCYVPIADIHADAYLDRKPGADLVPLASRVASTRTTFIPKIAIASTSELAVLHDPNEFLSLMLSSGV